MWKYLVVLFLLVVAAEAGSIDFSTDCVPGPNFANPPTSLDDIFYFGSNDTILFPLVRWILGERVGDPFNIGLTYDYTKNRLFWTDRIFSSGEYGRFYNFNPTDDSYTFVTNVGCPGALAMNKNGVFYNTHHCGIDGAIPNNRGITSRPALAGVNDLPPGSDVGTVLLDQYKSQGFREPRAIALRDDGTVYFTDVPSVSDFGTSFPVVGFNGLYRYFPSGDTVQLLHQFEGTPTALAFSPNQRQLYVSDGTNNAIHKFDVQKDGSLIYRDIFVNLTQADERGPSSLITDLHGNLYVGCVGNGGNYIVVRPDGTKLYRGGTGEAGDDYAIEESTGWSWGDYRGDSMLYIVAPLSGLFRAESCIPSRPMDGTCVTQEAPSGNPADFVACWDPVDPDTEGACCFDGECSITTPGQCDGEHYPDEDQCVPGRCLPDRGACCFGPDQDECSIVGGVDFCNGVYMGDDSTCARCTGACCTGTGCEIKAPGLCDAGAGETFIGSGADCSGCATGACCDGADCDDTGPAGLCLPPSLYYGDDVPCPGTCANPDNLATSGACCLGERCVITVDEDACEGMFHEGDDCSDGSNGEDVCFESLPNDGGFPTDGTVGDGNDGDGNDGDDDSDESTAERLSFFL